MKEKVVNKSFAESLKGVLADPVFWAGVSVASGFWGGVLVGLSLAA
jgi:hypothetical protein